MGFENVSLDHGRNMRSYLCIMFLCSEVKND